MKTNTLTTIGVNILVFLGLLLLIEVGCQVVVVMRPSYDVLFLQSDEVLGWKQVPNLRWTWTGPHWYASDFSVEVETNPLGFRDIARDFSKPQGVTRVALLGDSFIEAVQVPFAKTAGQLLENKLNTEYSRKSEPTQKWEVQNFGISNYGVGQYLLVWEQYANKYNPDYVAIFVAKFHMKRTVSKYEYGAFTATEKERLWIRPTFSFENGSLIREPARDYQRFAKIQEEVIKVDFDGKRMRTKKRTLITYHYGKILFEKLNRLFNQASSQIATQPKNNTDEDGILFATNLKIIEELGNKVRAAGSRLVVIDASQYFGDGEVVSTTLKGFCADHGFGYMPLYEELLKANRNGVSTRWTHDYHFNEMGNTILANSLFGWITQTSPVNASR